MRDDVRMKKVKSEEMEKDKQIQLRKQEIAQLRLQAQVEELHRSIRFFKEENEIIRRLLEESRRYSSMKTRGLRQALPTRLTYSGEKPPRDSPTCLFVCLIGILSGLEVAIRLLRAKYSGTHGVIATLTEMVRGSMIIQRITEKLLAPFAMHQHRNASRCSKHDSDRSRMCAVDKLFF